MMTIEQLEQQIAVVQRAIATEEEAARYGGRRDTFRIGRLRQDLFSLRHQLQEAQQPKDLAWDLSGRIRQNMDRFQIADLLRAKLEVPPTDKMREQFQLAYAEKCRNACAGTGAVFDAMSAFARAGDCYLLEATHAAWWGWQKALGVEV